MTERRNEERGGKEVQERDGKDKRRKADTEREREREEGKRSRAQRQVKDVEGKMIINRGIKIEKEM